MKKNCVVLLVLDGLGESKKEKGNAVKMAGTPNLDSLKKRFPYTLLNACGENVGLLKGQMGNSEAGHLNLGAGRIVRQDQKLITDSFENRQAEKNKVILSAFAHIKKYNSCLHLIGLCSDGGIHSELSHLKKLIEIASKNGMNKIFLHFFTDGRDTPVDSGKTYVETIERFAKKYGAKVATIGGRLYGMDREKRWERIQPAYDSIVNAKSANNFETTKQCFEHFYSQNIFDEFILPSVIDGGKRIEDGDSVIFFNYRNDRTRELTRAITQHNFDKFETRKIENLFFAGFTLYDKTLKNVKVIFPAEKRYAPLGEIVSKHNLKQFRVSETTKYAHVTFFFNGGRDLPYKNEDRLLIETKDIKSFDEFPQMRAKEISDAVINAIKSQKYSFILANITNCDMVGHTGNFEATKQAVKVVDDCVGDISKIALAENCSLLICADHGNADDMKTESGDKVTTHSLSKVPCVLVSNEHKYEKLQSNLGLSSISPTVLKLLKIKAPKHFTSQPLF